MKSFSKSGRWYKGIVSKKDRPQITRKMLGESGKP
jgi:hypothetical protein